MEIDVPPSLAPQRARAPQRPARRCSTLWMRSSARKQLNLFPRLSVCEEQRAKGMPYVVKPEVRHTDRFPHGGELRRWGVWRPRRALWVAEYEIVIHVVRGAFPCIDLRCSVQEPPLDHRGNRPSSCCAANRLMGPGCFRGERCDVIGRRIVRRNYGPPPGT